MTALSTISQAVDKHVPEAVDPRYTHADYHMALETLNSAFCHVAFPAREWSPAVTEALNIINDAFNAVREEQLAVCQ